ARSVKLRRTVTDPGVVAYHVPLSLTSEQCAPVRSTPWFVLTTEMLWLWPLTIEAQPAHTSALATAAATAAERVCIGTPSQGLFLVKSGGRQRGRRRRSR